MTDKTLIWDSLARVPKEHLKPFQREGGFKGTAIKPMWTFRRMTEHFGPCGTGWGVERPEFTIQPAGNDVMVFCTVAIWYGTKEAHVWGVGGDKILSVGKYGPKTDDEAFKKAFTDATTNALKMIGAAADIHMGLWDGNKYVDEKPERPGLSASVQTERDAGQANPFPADVVGTQGRPTYKGAKNSDHSEEYKVLSAAIRAQRSANDLVAWARDPINIAAMNKLSDKWLDDLRNEFDDRLDALKAVT